MNMVQNSIHCERKHILLTFLGAHFQTKYYLLDVRVKRDRFIGLCPVFCMAISGYTDKMVRQLWLGGRYLRCNN